MWKGFCGVDFCSFGEFDFGFLFFCGDLCCGDCFRYFIFSYWEEVGFFWGCVGDWEI